MTVSEKIRTIQTHQNCSITFYNDNKFVQLLLVMITNNKLVAEIAQLPQSKLLNNVLLALITRKIKITQNF